MSVRTKWYLRLGAYAVAIWNGTQIDLNLCNFGKWTYATSIKHSYFWQRIFQTKMQPKATCIIGWTWRPLMLVCMSLFVGLKWMQWIGLPSSTFGETCKTEGYLRSIDGSFVPNQDCFLTSQNITFSRILCNPKLRWRFKIKRTCQLTIIFVFENVMWHFRFEVECQMKFVKRTQWRLVLDHMRTPPTQYYLVAKPPTWNLTLAYYSKVVVLLFVYFVWFFSLNFNYKSCLWRCVDECREWPPTCHVIPTCHDVATWGDQSTVTWFKTWP